PFDLEKGPVFKVYLFSVTNENYVLLINMHHICSDGWSIGIILKELRELYDNEISGVQEPAASSEKKYSDFVNTQEELVNGEKGNALWTYWKDELSGELPVLNLPADKMRPAVQTFKGATEYFSLDKELVEDLKKLSREHGTTLFITLLTAYQILLHRYTSQDDIIIGTPTAGRNQTEFDNTVGYFINPVAIRGDLSVDLTFKEFQNQIRKKVLGAITNQDMPFPVIVERLLKKRDPSRSPVFQAFFGLQGVPKGKEVQELVVPGNKGAKISFGKLMLESYDISQQEGQFDLMLEFFEGEKLFAGVIKYSSGIFDKERIQRMPGHLNTLLKGIVNDPGKKISELPLLTENENNRIIEWNQTDVKYDTSKLIHEIISGQSQLNPDKIAVESGNEKLTYIELDTITDRLANLLLKNGVTTDSHLGVYLERSVEMIVALLGIIKAGGAYVPIDPTYPNERVEYMIQDSGVNIILSKKEFSNQLSDKDIKIILLDDDIGQINNETSGLKKMNISPDNLAYMIYTSGSTGKPKGAMNTHGGILNRLLWMKDYLNIKTDDNIFQKTSFSFDVSVWEFFLPLMCGAKLVFAKPEGHKDTRYLVDEIINKQITVMHFVPSMLQVFLEEEGVENCTSLEKVICSGEELTMSLQNIFFKKFPGTELHNLYGPTEAAVDVTYWKCDKESRLNSVPIGKPVANTRIHILDGHLNPVPVGIPGELHIGGVQVARGYYNRPDLTNEKFIPDPFSKKEKTRLYKTGDLVRYIHDGNIEYLGRIDNQIKIRGFRIELGEIEIVLIQCNDVKEAVVIAKEIREGDKRLIAFVVPRGQDDASVNSIRQFLKDKLPEYMIPSQFVFLDEIPLSQNGKVDRKALSSMEFSRDELKSEYKEASKPVEEILAEIWKQVLSIDKVGVNDNFFELGGDSIISIQIIFKANRAGLKISPKQIFQYQTISELSSVIEKDFVSEAEQGLVTGEVPLTPVQHWFFEMNLPGQDHFNHSVMLNVPKGLNEKFLETAVEKIISHHDALRTKFTKDNLDVKQFIGGENTVTSFSTVDLSGTDQSKISDAIRNNIIELQKSINLGNGETIKVRLYKTLSGNDDKLLIIVHHLVIDGISWRILMEDLYTAYDQLSKNNTITLPEKTTSYKEWSKGLNEFASSENLTAGKDHWLSLANINIPPVPADSPDGENTVGSIATVSVELDEQNTQSLLKEVPKAYNTQINDILLTALIISYNKWSSNNKLLINLEGHGREDINDSVDVSRTIGWFTSIFPVLLETSNPDDISETVKSVKESLRQIPDNGIGFGVLKYLNKDKTIQEAFRALPVPEIVFNYLGQVNQNIVQGSEWKLGKRLIVLDQNSGGRNYHKLEINSIISGSKLRVDL
ncbi:MAG: amino acid adenylation domain-containing protein, partial [Ignavibacteria bacterium]